MLSIKQMKFLLIINLLLLFFIKSETFAQRPIERNILINPLSDTSLFNENSKSGWAYSFGGWGSFGRYIIGDHDHTWYQQLGAFTELYRFNNASSIVFTTQIEFIADLHNNINFNPRAIFWEEGIFFIKKHNNIYWKMGYYHRCKHDIDNLELGFERSLIFGSLMGAVYFPVNTIEERDIIFGITQDFYTITYDSRKPHHYRDSGDNWYQLLSSTRLNFNIELTFKNSVSGIFLKGFSLLTLYSDYEGILDRYNGIKKAVFHPGLSAGIFLRGNADIRLGINYEYMPDTGLHIVPRSSHLLSFGIKVLDPGNLK